MAEELILNFKEFNLTDSSLVLTEEKRETIIIQGKEEKRDTIIALGKTGAGKSSILNSIANKRDLFSEGESLSSTTKELQKQESLFRGDRPPHLWLIDTPGLYDTEQADEKYITELLNGVQHEEFKIILFCINISEPKFDTTIQFSIKILATIFGKDIYSRVFLTFTNLNKIKDAEKILRIKQVNKQYPNCLAEANIPITNEFLFYEHEEPPEGDGLGSLPELLAKIPIPYIPEFVLKKRQEIEKMGELIQEAGAMKIKVLRDQRQNLKSEMEEFKSKLRSQIASDQLARETSLKAREKQRLELDINWKASITKVMQENERNFERALIERDKLQSQFVNTAREAVNSNKNALILAIKNEKERISTITVEIIDKDKGIFFINNFATERKNFPQFIRRKQESLTEITNSWNDKINKKRINMNSQLEMFGNKINHYGTKDVDRLNQITNQMRQDGDTESNAEYLYRKELGSLEYGPILK